MKLTKLKQKTTVIGVCLAVMLFFSSVLQAATHNIELSAETLPNGQFSLTAPRALLAAR